MIIDTIQIGRHTCRAYLNMPYNAYEIAAPGPTIRKRGRTVLRCMVSAELFEDSALDWRSLVAQQLDAAYESAYRFAPVMQRKIRRMVRV